MKQPTLEELVGLRAEYWILENVIFQLVFESCNIEDGIGLEDKENFFSKKHLLTVRFPIDFIIHAFL